MSTEQFQELIQQAKQLSAEERKKLIKYLVEAELEAQPDQSTVSTDYLALFGSGRGVYGSPEEADEFIRNERDAWEH